MNKIETYADLMVEKNRLEILLSIQKETILMDINQLKIEFQPTMDLLKFMNKITTKGKDNTLISAGVNIIGELLLKNILLAKSGWIVRLIVPYLVKNYSSHALAKDGNVFLPRLLTFITKMTQPK